MAKGNDGNYLQHSLEVAIAIQLAALQPEGRLHIALAHGMAPFEPCDEPGGGRSRRLLKDALNKSYRDPQPKELSIVSAYRATKAAFSRYPNSAELLRKTVQHLAGGITEVEEQRYKALRAAWEGSPVLVRHASWRSEIESPGVLACPSSLGSPWLVSLDPMTYVQDGLADDYHLHRDDLPALAAALQRYVNSGQPGSATIFVYAVEPNVRALFWEFVDDLARATGLCAAAGWVAHYRDKRNVAAILSTGVELDQNLPTGIQSSR